MEQTAFSWEGVAVEEDAVEAVLGFDLVEAWAGGADVGEFFDEAVKGDAEVFGDGLGFFFGEGHEAGGSCAAGTAHGAFELQSRRHYPLAGMAVLYAECRELRIVPFLKEDAADSRIRTCSSTFEQAQKSHREGGIPIGAALGTAEGVVLAVGHNLRVQAGGLDGARGDGVFAERGAAAGLAHADAREHAEPVRDVLRGGAAAPDPTGRDRRKPHVSR